MDAIQPSEESAARVWLQGMSLPATEEKITNTLRQWQLWKTATTAARDANLALELKSLTPENESKFVLLNGRVQLQAMSTANLANLQEKISARIPLPKEPTPEILALAKAMAAKIAFHYLQPYHTSVETGVYPPLPSARELGKFGIDVHPSYYSRLVGKSASVGFSIVAANREAGPYYLNAQQPFTAYRLGDDLARKEAFVVPNFSNVNALLTFLNSWEPQLIEKLRRQNRMSLPFEIKDAKQFLQYLDPTRIDEVFPDNSAYDRLALAREALGKYVLTEPDARALLLWAFERWLAHVSLMDPVEFGRLQTEFNIPAGAQAVFTKKFLKELGLPDLSVRVPLAVGPRDFSIVRIENVMYNPFPDYTARRQKPWDSRRLDHDSKP